MNSNIKNKLLVFGNGLLWAVIAAVAFFTFALLFLKYEFVKMLVGFGVMPYIFGEWFGKLSNKCYKTYIEPRLEKKEIYE